ncbi:N-acetylglucosamine kinase [Streptomyces sporangiiformans]|uniref:ATPase n=1 Tax=Streptomyces sporangiiformans TaxID=2315329 RepID=A0A505DP04_9ACTN|nr:BadF/BadG/BcrA/BcrD ATPase family protein [Streptomyces sporangiiformans]TPQ22979.1 ATPase [Streptomyces sporangiiformans]
MSNELNQDLVVGLDAGGTRTRAVLATAEDGRPLGEGLAGPGNALTVPVPQLTEHLAEAVGQAVPEGARGRVVAVAGGFAGATGASPDEPGRLNALAALTAALRGLHITAESVGISSDIEAAFASAPGAPADGLALVAGTGAVAARISGRRCAATVDGDGWLLGDDGSGFWIGRSAVRAALRMADGRGDPTMLAASVGRALELPEEVLPHEAEGLPHEAGGLPHEAGGLPDEADVLPDEADVLPYAGEGAVPREWTRHRREAYRMHLLPAVMAQPPIRLARLAPLVVEAAGRKDAVAGAILDGAADQLIEAVRALAPRPGERIVATGGLLGPHGPLTAPLTGRLQVLGLTLDWVADGCRGAVALARLGAT